MNIEVAIEIDAPPARVWEVMSDVERWSEWTDSISSIKFEKGSALRPGSKLRIRQPKLPPAVWQVTSVEPGRGFVWEAKGSGLSSMASHEIEPLDGGRSRVKLRIEHSGMIATLLGSKIEGVSRRYLDMEIQGLKRRSEAGRG